MADYLELVGALDLTGDPTLSFSRIFAGAVLAKTFVIMLDMIRIANDIDYPSEEWRSLWFFFTFLGMALGCYLAAVLASAGNARKPERFVKCRCILSMVMSVNTFVFPSWNRHHDFKNSGALTKVFVWGSTVVELFLAVAMIVVMCARLMDKDTENQILLKQDSSGRWGADDVHGLEKIAGVENSYYAEENSDRLVGPNMIAEIKGLLFPQPFTDTHRFPNVEKYAQVAKDVRIVYPIRLWTAMFITGVSLIINYIGSLALLVPELGKAADHVEMIPGVDSQAEREAYEQRLAQVNAQLANIRPPASASGSTAANATKQAAADLLSWSLQHPTTVANCVNSFQSGLGCSQIDNISLAIEQALQKELDLNAQYQTLQVEMRMLEWEINETKKYTQWWIDELNRMFVILIITNTVCTLLGLWFVWVGKMAYRKKVIELMLSHVRYPFDPKVMTGVRDTKFVSYFVFSIVLGWMLLNIILPIVGFVFSLNEVWEFIWDIKTALFAWLIYMGFTIIVVPTVHGKLVLDKQKRLAKPVLQSSLIFVWELFYAPQVAMSVFLKALYCMGFAMVNFFRPDVPLLPHGFVWLDSMHSAYVASVYAQIDAAARRTAIQSTHNGQSNGMEIDPGKVGAYLETSQSGPENVSVPVLPSDADCGVFMPESNPTPIFQAHFITNLEEMEI